MTTKAGPRPTRTLFAISEDLLAIESLIEQAEGDISDPVVESVITSWLQELGNDQGRKIDAYVNLMRKWDGQRAAAKAEADRYTKTVRVLEARSERLQARLKQHMEITNTRRIETPSGRTVAVQNNGGLCPLQFASEVDPAKLDPKFQRVSVSINTEAVRAALDAGEEMAFARLGQRGTSLRIR